MNKEQVSDLLGALMWGCISLGIFALVCGFYLGIGFALNFSR